MARGGRGELTTKRCILRPVTADDARSLHELWSSAGVRRFLWDDKVIPITRTLEAIEQSELLFREHRCGLWSVTPLHASTFIGFGGLWPFRDPPEMELLYGVAEVAWGRGYATEIAEAVTTHCFTQLAMPTVRASTDVANFASIRVLEKLGFLLVRRAVVDGLKTAFYELTPHGV